MEALHTAGRPPESLLGVSQVGHDVAVFPAALLRARPAQVGGGRAAVVHGAKSGSGQDFMLVIGEKCVLHICVSNNTVLANGYK